MSGALRRSAWRLAAVGLVILIAPAAGRATSPSAPRVPGIGYLANEPTPDSIPVLRARLRELDWVDGRSITIWPRYAQGKPDLYARHAEDLVRMNVAAIVAVGGPAIEAARQATKTVPIVMVALDDPRAAGAPRPPENTPTNLTGLSTFSAEASARRLELLKQIVPGLARVAALWNSASPGAAADLRATQEAARAGGVDVVSVEIRGDGDVREAFSRVQAQAPQGLLVLSDALVLAHRQRIASLASRARLPAMFPFRDFVEAGGLIAYGPAWPDVFDQAARLVDRILRGARPSDLPMVRPGRSELVINLRAARALALKVPAPLLQRADRVIQ
jgi:putative tryptophan/tyrosine transport system substrate-binding protein